VQKDAASTTPLCDINQEALHYKIGDGELPPPPPSSFYDGIHLAMAKFMADTTRHIIEVMA
jgi:hypothetical protein